MVEEALICCVTRFANSASFCCKVCSSLDTFSFRADIWMICSSLYLASSALSSTNLEFALASCCSKNAFDVRNRVFSISKAAKSALNWRLSLAFFSVSCKCCKARSSLSCNTFAVASEEAKRASSCCILVSLAASLARSTFLAASNCCTLVQSTKPLLESVRRSATIGSYTDCNSGQNIPGCLYLLGLARSCSSIFSIPRLHVHGMM
mmetsp:Transcript_10600/g.18807  ORF Transcript_10600/g.18807 Transcript_10600/m.18807 type:complete len:207 (+) Transcript_10600:1554-2174(+)